MFTMPSHTEQQVPRDSWPLGRRARRVELPNAVEIHTNGFPARLVDVSALGAQVVSGRILRPNEQIRLIVRRNGRVVRAEGTVAWSNMELVDTRPRYRAGIAFKAAVGELVQHAMSSAVATTS